MSDPQLLPNHLTKRSLSKSETVLDHDDAIEAVKYLAENGYFVFAWEGWIKTADGRHGHSGYHQGTVEFWGTKGQPIQQRVNEAADFARQTIIASQRRWNDEPEVAGATLYFCLSVEAANNIDTAPAETNEES